jgi:hypothetical protein
LRLTRVRHREEQPLTNHDQEPGDDRPQHQPELHSATSVSGPADQRDRQTPGAARKDATHPAMLVLLCSDCCALIVGAIDDDEWRRRIDHSAPHTNLAMLPSPAAPEPETIPLPTRAKSETI